ncbi:hypothetical protein [Lysobacter gummosus]|uniref:hypothetical protein n=1 Tax=Lysobacter gummosus TaxID=262324 RepID=UPI0036339A69
MLLRSDRSVSPPRANPPRSNLSPADPVSPGARPFSKGGKDSCPPAISPPLSNSSPFEKGG